MQARNDHEAGEQVHLASREDTRNIQIILAQAISAGQEVSARVSWKARGSSRVLIEFDLRANVAQSSSFSEKSAYPTGIIIAPDFWAKTPKWEVFSLETAPFRMVRRTVWHST